MRKIINMQNLIINVSQNVSTKSTQLRIYNTFIKKYIISN